MRVLMITGDKSFGPGHPRYELQRSVVDELNVVYFGRGHLWPKIPKGHFDVVTAQDPLWRGHLAWHISRRLGIRLNIQVHSDLQAYPWWLRIWARFNLRRATSVRVVSEKIKKQALAFGVSSPIAVLPVYVDVERFRVLEPRPHVHKVILWIGRFESEKDPLYAIDILEAAQRAGIDAKLIMVGTGSLNEELVRYVHSRATPLPVECPGWQSDITPYLEIADVVLSTSLHESWGASIVEALAAHVAVVAPDVGIAKEAGATVVPRGELAQAVMRVLQSDTRGELKLTLPTAPEWARLWRETLL